MHNETKIENTYVIGDVHGCFHTLKNLLLQLPKDAELIFVGDLCDKGNFSKDVINFVMKNEYLCVKGNHEHLMQKYMYDAVIHDKHSPWSSDKRYGGLVTLQSYVDDRACMIEHLKWVENLPTYIEVGPYFITHGFALPFHEHRDNPAYYDDYLLNRYEEGMKVEDSRDVINIFGHCVFDEVISGKAFYAIDTGCSYGNKLTAIQLGTMKLYQEPMDGKDSAYRIKELKLSHLDNKNTIESFIKHVDDRFVDFDLVSSEVARHIAETFGEAGKKEIHNMLEKGQLFMKQAKKILENL